MSLLEEDQRLLEIFQQLAEAYSLGYSISSSPVTLYLRAMIDLSLKLSNLFETGGTTWDRKVNKTLQFFDGETGLPWQPDALGNPRQRMFREKPSESAWSPQLSEYFREMAKDLVLIKRSKLLPKHLYCSEKTENLKKKIKQKSYHFFRRTRYKRSH